MSHEINCPNCGEPVPAGVGRCSRCGHQLGAGGSGGLGISLSGIHPIAPVVFVVAAVVIGGLGSLLVSLAFGVPVGLLGGGLGVWVLERGRRVLH